MTKPFLALSTLTLLLTTQAKADRFLIDPSKVETLRCDDASYANESHILTGPEQSFVFTGADGQTHSLMFKDHEACRAKMQFVKNAQTDANHPWVQIDTAQMTFANVTPPETQQATRQISSTHEHTR
jgi:hypothetical protein